jgi:hypothetical protein
LLGRFETGGFQGYVLAYQQAGIFKTADLQEALDPRYGTRDHGLQCITASPRDRLLWGSVTPLQSADIKGGRSTKAPTPPSQWSFFAPIPPETVTILTLGKVCPYGRPHSLTGSLSAR